MEDILGKPISRVDGPAKVTGRAPYAYEFKIPNAAQAVLITSSIAKGRIVSIDTAAAERVPGVLLVMTHLNSPKLPQLQQQKKAPPAGRIVQVLQDNQVFYSNQPVVMVVAETLVAAQEAAKRVQIRYAAEQPEVGLDSRLNQAEEPPKDDSGEPASTKRGDMQAGLSQAAAHIRQTYSTPYEVHNPMEPHATVAVWDRPDHLTLYDATQGVFTDQSRVAFLLGLKPENVRVISLFLGGGFGSKGPVWSHVILAALAARQVKRPVRLAVERNQMFGMVGFRSATHQALAVGAAQDGRLTALGHDTICQTSRFDDFMESSSFAARMLYQAPNNSTSQKWVRSDTGTPSFMRAPGEASGNFALECAMDELAYELKMDPLEFRLKNYAEMDPQKNIPWSSKSLRECYRIGAEKFGWSNRPAKPRSLRKGDVLTGWGMATAAYPTRRSPSSAVAELRADGTLYVEAGTQDIGTGTYTIMTQIGAQVFGLPPERVKSRLGDTIYPKTPVSGGSQTTASTGSAVYLAAQGLREKVIQMAVSDSASPLSGVSAQDVVLDRGVISSRNDPSKKENLRTLLERNQQTSLRSEAHAEPGDEKKHYSMYAFGAQFAEVQVDASLGMVTVTRLIGCFGAGRILNAKTARNQFIGGMIWGMGMALYEQAVMDERVGRWVNNNLAEYHVACNADARLVEAYWVDEKDDHINPIGAKGIGEIGITGSAAAIANAVFHATGKRVRDLPITCDKLLA